jgi:uncharacterized membrane protein
MKRNEFIADLKEALEHNLSEQKIKEHVDYYEEYIRNEVKSGRTEEEVMNELGDPWAIAKNIISAEEAGSSNYEEYSYSSDDSDISRQSSSRQSSGGPNIHVFGFDKWWKKLLLILGIIGVVMIVFSIITGIISLIAPFIIPVIIISFILKLLKKR